MIVVMLEQIGCKIEGHHWEYICNFELLAEVYQVILCLCWPSLTLCDLVGDPLQYGLQNPAVDHLWFDIMDHGAGLSSTFVTMFVGSCAMLLILPS